jgi:nicotinate-nucleotide adenylyltransferase
MGERRVAAFGGTFDPIHNGHLEIARAIVRNFGLDRLLIVPAHRPPHKNARAISDAYHRYAMAAFATLDEPRVSVSTIELEAPDRPYTYETVERLRLIFGAKTGLFFVMGADSFEEITTWREPARILSNVDIIVATRPGHEVKSSHLDAGFRSSVIDLRELEGGPDLAAANDERHIYIAGYVNTAVSSTEIRRRVRDNESIEGFVDTRVEDYIKKYELYRR